MSELEAIEKTQKDGFKIYFYVLLVIAIGTIGYLFNKNAASETAINAKNSDLRLQIEQLKNSLEKNNQKLGSKEAELKSYDQYQTILKFVRLRDTVYKSLPFKYGQKVMILPDSTKGVINSIAITANELEYSIKYLVKIKGGKYETYSVTDLLDDQH
jgi:hypothetical protein